MGDDDNGSASEKKEDGSRTPVSDADFKRMLSQNSMAIDDDISSVGLDDAADAVVAVENEELDFNKSPKAKSPKFREQLTRLLETKQRRYAMEYKKEAIVEQHRKKRKHVREQQRLDRHKAMEKEIEEIEAEFLSPLGTMQPLSPKQGSGNMNGSVITASPSASRMSAPSPGRTNKGGRHQRHNSLGGRSPFRRQTAGHHNMGAPSPRVVASRTGGGGDIFRPKTSYDRTSNSDKSSSPPHHRLHSLDEFDVSQDYKLKVRPVNMFESNMFSPDHAIPKEDLDSLSMPSFFGKDGDSKYPSPQSVIDGVLQPMPSGQHHLFNSRNINHRRTRTPTRPSGNNQQQHRRFHSHEVENPFDPFDGNSSLSSMPSGRLHPPMSPMRGSSHRRTNSSAGTPTGHHRRSSSQHSLGGRHRRTGSHAGHKQPDDIFLHGVVAQTRFV